MTLPQETIETIKTEAEAATNNAAIELRAKDMEYAPMIMRLFGYKEGYIAGATEWAGKAQEERMWYLKRIQSLKDTLDKIIHAPIPANDREYISWLVTSKNIAGGAISNDDAEVEVAKYKEVGNG